LNGDFFGMAGLCAKAGKMVYGAYACDRGIKSGKIKLLLIDDTASANTLKEFADACAYYNVPIIINKKQKKIGAAVGKPANKIFGIVCPEFSKRIMEIHEDIISGGVKV
jgi:ribosomal protein L7Ae-like RNA K-turn-binding protein